MSDQPDSHERVRTRRLRGDNQLKGGRSERALEAFKQARAAVAAGAEASLCELVERRIESERALIGEQSTP